MMLLILVYFSISKIRMDGQYLDFCFFVVNRLNAAEINQLH